MKALDIATSVFASSSRAWRGTAAFTSTPSKPEKLLELYEYEGCPFCRLVREVLCELDLDAIIYPCPKGGMRFRGTAIDLSGASQFPLLVDPNNDVVLLESAEIIDYLYHQYGGGRRRASRGVLRQVDMLSSLAATALRSSPKPRGMYAAESTPPAQPLELYSFESSPYARLVRERLSELEIPYRLRNFAKSRWQEMGPPIVREKFFPDAPITSDNRLRLRELTGRSQVPYLVDPNTGVAMFESADIIDYLNENYAE